MATFVRYKDFQPVNLDLVVTFFRIISFDLNKYDLVFKQPSRKFPDYIWNFNTKEELDEVYQKILVESTREIL